MENSINQQPQPIKNKPTKPFFMGAILSIISSVICLCVSINYELNHIGGATVSIMKRAGDTKGVHQYYFTDNMMTLLMWIGVILFALAIIFLIIGFVNNKKIKGENK